MLCISCIFLVTFDFTFRLLSPVAASATLSRSFAMLGFPLLSVLGFRAGGFDGAAVACCAVAVFTVAVGCWLLTGVATVCVFVVGDVAGVLASLVWDAVCACGIGTA